ncbi:MAG: hypothetical protein ACUVTW_15085 [Thermogutta sp.]
MAGIDLHHGGRQSTAISFGGRFSRAPVRGPSLSFTTEKRGSKKRPAGTPFFQQLIWTMTDSDFLTDDDVTDDDAI